MYVCENSTGSAYCFYDSMIPTVSCILSTNCSHSNTVRRLKDKSGDSYFLWARGVKVTDQCFLAFCRKLSGKAWPVQDLLGCCVCLEGTVPLPRRMKWEMRLPCAPEGSETWPCCPREMLLVCTQGLSLKAIECFWLRSHELCGVSSGLVLAYLL